MYLSTDIDNVITKCYVNMSC